MEDLISISEVAKKMGWSYHTTRNRLARDQETKDLAIKIGHAVCYKREVLEVLRGTTKLSS